MPLLAWISLAAREYQLANFARSIKIDAVIDAFSEDRRNTGTPDRGAEHDGCVGRRFGASITEAVDTRGEHAENKHPDGGCQ